MFIFYDNNGKITSKIISVSKDYVIDKPHIEIDDNFEFDINSYKVNLNTLQLESSEIFLSDEELIEKTKQLRILLLQESDWTDTASAVTRLPNYQQWHDYRQALRDIPQQSGYPLNVIWPEQPK